jgi:chaperonin GroES
MQIKPISDHILVKPSAAETMTASGIIIPDTVEKEQAERGEVIAVGPGKMLDTGSRAVMDVAVGQTVLFNKYSPDIIRIDFH